MQVCFGQHGEDLILARALGWKSAGFYVDVGAAHPTTLSVTRLFYERGWHGINIEPLPHMFAALQKARSRDINLQVAAADQPGELAFFEVAAESCRDWAGQSGLSTFDHAMAERYREQGHRVKELAVRVVTLDDVLEQHAPPTIDFLKVDVEGHESAVLAGLDLNRFRPRVIVVEAVRPLTDTACHEEWEPKLTGMSYQFAMFDGVNRYYVRHEERQLVEKFRPLNASEFVRIGDYGAWTFAKRWLKPWEVRVKNWLRRENRAA